MELNEAKDKLLEFFQSGEQFSEKKEEETIARVPEFLSIEEGQACLDRYNQRTNQAVELSFSDTILLSLIEDIPDKADMMMELPHLHGAGILFKYPPKKNSISGGRGSNVRPFKPEIMTLLNLAILPRQISITNLDEISNRYYQDIINNIDVIRRNMKHAIPEHGPLSKDSIMDLEKHQSSPLYEIASGEDLITSTALNIRNLLAAIFKDESDGEDFFDDVDYVFFYHDALFFIKDDDVQAFESNARYKRFFYLSKGEISEQLPSKPKTKINTDPGTVGQKVIDRFHEAIHKGISELYIEQGWYGGIEDLAYNSKERYGVELYIKNLRRFRELQDPDVVETVKDLMNDLSPMLSKYFDYMFMQDKRRNIKHGNPKALKGYMTRFRQKLLNPQYVNKVLTGQVPYSRAIEDVDSLDIGELTALRHTGDKFLPQIYARLLTTIFSKIVKGSEHSDALNALKGVINPSLMRRQIKASRQYGFKPSDPKTEYAMLLNYFVNYGCLYLLERRKGITTGQVPPQFEAFFQKHLIKAHKSLTEGE